MTTIKKEDLRMFCVDWKDPASDVMEAVNRLLSEADIEARFESVPSFGDEFAFALLKKDEELPDDETLEEWTNGDC